jgi:prepilin-type N-terminal cleavage/methylation domain-containing protein
MFILLIKKRKKMINKVKNATKKGFSLVELLVVVAIIGVLAGVGIVAYNNYIDDADKKVAKANATLLAKKISAERATPTDDFGTSPKLARDSSAALFVTRAKTYASGINITLSALPGTTAAAICADLNSVGIYEKNSGVSVCYNDGAVGEIKAY